MVAPLGAAVFFKDQVISNALIFMWINLLEIATNKKPTAKPFPCMDCVSMSIIAPPLKSE